MAELAITVRDKANHHPMFVGEWEVLCVCPDGWQWSPVELAHPDWRMVRLPGISVSDASRWIADEAVDGATYLRRQRHFKLVPERFSKDEQAWLADDSRKQPVRDFEPVAWEKGFRTRVPKPLSGVIADDNVIG